MLEGSCAGGRERRDPAGAIDEIGAELTLELTDLTTVGRDAIRALWREVLSHAPHFEQEAPLPTLISGDIALTSTPPQDGSGARAQVVRRQADGTWLRLLDQPEFNAPTN